MDNSTSSYGDPTATTIVPFLSVRDGRGAVEFYEEAFGAIEGRRFEGGADGIVAELAVDDAQFYVTDESEEHSNVSPDSLGGTSVRISLVVEDPDSVFERAIGAGAKEVWPVADQHWGWRQGRVVDPFGHHWLIGTRIAPHVE